MRAQAGCPRIASKVEGGLPMLESLPIHVAIIEDDNFDAMFLQKSIETDEVRTWCFTQYTSVDGFVADRDAAPDVIFLDRHLDGEGLTEGLIPVIRAAFPDAGIVLYTGHMTPSLVAGAAHFGAFATFEKGRLTDQELIDVAIAAARVGPIMNRVPERRSA